ncbi:MULTISPECIES: hypothetical protein [unclassified Rhizobium]|uniref:hypothetical protein n=1 Tax=unclassified Rhizobium TaxID=2613769 RepID=UPI001C834F88|nr:MULTISPECIES: hypothetical protein [unclassified Rhizobium]MBX5247857.1 hypothetical protein [Rhizobium sp. NLR3b]MBX5308540.1 hypothetical protein [Rhizobium sp. NLR14b]
MIAYLQWRTAHQKVVLDLFDRRMAIYRDVRSIVDDAALDADPSNDDLMKRIHRLKQEASFLFGDDVMTSILSLEEVVIRISTATLTDGVKKAIGKRELSLIEELKIGKLRSQAADLLDSISAAMKPYMRMGEKRMRTAAEWFHDRNEIRKSYEDK